MNRFVLLGLFAAAAVATAKEITLPTETGALAKGDGPGYALASGLCVTCHSIDYIQYQPPNEPKKFWLAEVTKMKKVYGAPIADDQIDPIASYLEAMYGAEAKH